MKNERVQYWGFPTSAGTAVVLTDSKGYGISTSRPYRKAHIGEIAKAAGMPQGAKQLTRKNVVDMLGQKRADSMVREFRDRHMQFMKGKKSSSMKDRRLSSRMRTRGTPTRSRMGARMRARV